jgi:hypothetical protein
LRAARVSRECGEQKPSGPPREEQPDHRPGGRENPALHELLPDDPRAASAEREPQ